MKTRIHTDIYLDDDSSLAELIRNCAYAGVTIEFNELVVIKDNTPDMNLSHEEVIEQCKSGARIADVFITYDSPRQDFFIDDNILPK